MLAQEKHERIKEYDAHTEKVEGLEQELVAHMKISDADKKLVEQVVNAFDGPVNFANLGAFEKHVCNQLDCCDFLKYSSGMSSQLAAGNVCRDDIIRCWRQALLCLMFSTYDPEA